jgi:bifunctional DNase/RNase
MTNLQVGGQEEPFVELAIAGIELGSEDARPAIGTIQLVDMASGERLDIVMARADALCVQQAVADQDSPRPRTHDLVLAAIIGLGGRVTEARILDRRTGGVFLAELVLEAADGSEVRLDARPSDALNVALRSRGASLTAHPALLAASLN